MTVNPSSAPAPGSASPNQDRRRVRRWWLIGGSIAVALVLIGAAAVYAGSSLTDDREPNAELVQPSAVAPTTTPGLPSYFLPTEQPDVGFDCMQVFAILADMVGVDVDYVETRRTAVEWLSKLEPDTRTQQAGLDELIDELDAAAGMVEDDPSAEAEATIRERAARDAFIESGACD